ncbi:MAG: UDP-glucose 4-epimerase GalE [Bacteroidales bacterium]|nr:UDP-glucose 4-epimerase GalE [Bacteroidales bacterium]
MSKIMVTGGTGYIGSHTIIELIKKGGFDVISVDNCVRSTPETIGRIKNITGKRVENYFVDICDKEKLFQLFEEENDIIGIIHFAALKSVPESVEKPLEYYRNNLQSLENVLEACEIFSIPNFIFSSSCSIYGEVEKLPVSEETLVGAPFCPYAHTKQIGEEMIRFFADIHPKLSFVMLRYFNPVGADMSGLNGELSPEKPNNLMPIITQVGIGKMQKMKVFGTDYNTRDGSCIRDYVHVTDIADAHIKALDFLVEGRNKSNLEVFNLGSGTGVTVLEMIHAFERITGVKLNYVLGERRPGDVPAIYSNSNKAERELGWTCKYSLDDMIISAWQWENYLKNNA